MTTDVIVVGSGASAVNAAWPLVHAGLRVQMLDVGIRDHAYAPLIAEEPFLKLRRTDQQQHRYLLGDDFEGVPAGNVRVGAQLTPPRAFIRHDTDRLTPVVSGSFAGMESLAQGGLAAGWGAGVGRFTSADLGRTPLTLAELEPHYDVVERRIGVCGSRDDLSTELGDAPSLMPPLPIDSGSRAIMARYLARRDSMHAAGLRIGVTRLAACSCPHEDRGPHPLTDMDFWADHARAVYRPRWTLDRLREHQNFTYSDGCLVGSFLEDAEGVQLTCRRQPNGDSVAFRARAVVLAAGVFGTARIVLRSLAAFDRSLPFVANPYVYAPCLNIGTLDGATDEPRHSLSQLTGVFDPGDQSAPLHVSVYSYRSLLTFKLMKEAPLSMSVSRTLLQALMPAITILGIHHPDRPGTGKRLRLLRGDAGGPDRLAIEYSPEAAEAVAIDHRERQCLRRFRRLGCYAFRRIHPGHGSSIHYAGTFPMARNPTEFQTNPNGLLAGTRAVYLADGSLLPDLPAKGLTLTLMANADRVGTRLAEALRA